MEHSIQALGASLSIARTAAPIREQVEKSLRQAIVDGQFRPGDRLIERELCAAFGVSRTSLREALRQLEVDGLIVNIPNKGLVVATVTVEEAEEIYQARAVLEGLAGRLFAERAPAEQITALSHAVAMIEEMQQHGDQRELLKAKDRFYEVLLHGSGNRTVYSLLMSLHDRIASLRALTLTQPGRSVQSVEEIRQIVAAVKRHDPDGTWQACVEHVHNAMAIALQALHAQQEEQQNL